MSAKRCPLHALNLPNRLTLLRVVLAPVYLILLWLSTRHSPAALRLLALAVFVLASLTDLLDGQIARRRGLVTNFGKFTDPIADKILTHTAFILLTWMGELSPLSCIVFVSREFVVAALREIAAEQGIVIAAGMSGKVKTVLQMALIVVLTLPGQALRPLALTLEVAAVAMTLYSMVEYIARNRHVLGGAR